MLNFNPSIKQEICKLHEVHILDNYSNYYWYLKNRVKSLCQVLNVMVDGSGKRKGTNVMDVRRRARRFMGMRSRNWEAQMKTGADERRCWKNQAAALAAVSLSYLMRSCSRVSRRAGSSGMQATGHKSAHCGSSKCPTHSVQRFGSIW